LGWIWIYSVVTCEFLINFNYRNELFDILTGIIYNYFYKKYFNKIRYKYNN